MLTIVQAIVNAGADLLSVLFFDLKNYLPFFLWRKGSFNSSAGCSFNTSCLVGMFPFVQRKRISSSPFCGFLWTRTKVLNGKVFKCICDLSICKIQGSWIHERENVNNGYREFWCKWSSSWHRQVSLHFCFWQLEGCDVRLIFRINAIIHWSFWTPEWFPLHLCCTDHVSCFYEFLHSGIYLSFPFA